MIRYIIVDDEHIAHDIIKGYCEKLPHLRLMGHCYDAIEALEYLGKNEVDLIFLDLNMPKLKGFEFLKSLPAPPQIIVTTAYEAYAVEGYELNIVDYLLKPFGFERFVKAINKVVLRKTPSRSTSEQPLKESVFFHSNKKHIQVKLEEILFAEALGNYCKIVTVKEEFRIREKISALSEMLPDTLFVQVHKSYLVARQHIDSIEGNRITLSGHTIPIGKHYKMNVNSLFLK